MISLNTNYMCLLSSGASLQTDMKPVFLSPAASHISRHTSRSLAFSSTHTFPGLLKEGVQRDTMKVCFSGGKSGPTPAPQDPQCTSEHSPLLATIHSFSYKGASCNLESKQFSLTGGKATKTVSSVQSLVTGVAEDKDERKGQQRHANR